MVAITQRYLTNNDCYKTGKKITPKGIMVHSTGANNPNLYRYIQPDDGVLGKNPYNNDWNRSGVEACVHAFIGKDKDGNVRIYQTLPWNYRAWHAAGKANDTHISFEICEDDLSDANYFKQVYLAAVELCAYLCQLYNLSPDTIICHSEGYQKGIASNHRDVMHWFPKHGKNMDIFRKDVAAKLSVKKEGWVKENSKWYFYQNGKKQTGWIKDKGKWYFLDSNGVMQTGLIQYKGKWYYLKKNGEMLSDTTVTIDKDGAIHFE